MHIFIHTRNVRQIFLSDIFSCTMRAKPCSILQMSAKWNMQRSNINGHVAVQQNIAYACREAAGRLYVQGPSLMHNFDHARIILNIMEYVSRYAAAPSVYWGGGWINVYVPSGREVVPLQYIYRDCIEGSWLL